MMDVLDAAGEHRRNPQSYDDFLTQRATLEELLLRLRDVLDGLKLGDDIRTVDRSLARLRADNFKVLVMGEFRRGKSTFINALLGQEVLPSFAVPTTAIINEVKWSEEPRAVLHYRTDGPAGPQPPKEIPVTDLKHYVTIRTRPDDPGGMEESPYERAEIFWRLDLCREGVEIIDSPGLNESAIRQRITLDYLRTVDAVVFVIACDFPVSVSETKAIEGIRRVGHEDLFFVCNRINVIRAREQASVKERCISLLGPLSRGGSNRVFFVDALSALDGRIDGHPARVAGSGLPEAEAALKDFLAGERGRIKIVRPATEVRGLIRAARHVIPDRERLEQTPLAVIEERYGKAQQELQALELARQQIIGRVQNFRADLRQDVADRAAVFFGKVASEVPGWTKAYTPEKGLNLLEAAFSNEAKEVLVRDIVGHLTTKVGDEAKAWGEGTLQPIITQRLDDLSGELDDKTREFLERLERVRIEVVAGDFSGVTASEALKEPSAWQRALAVAGGLAIQDPAVAIVGGMFGLKDMAVAFGFQAAAFVATGLLVSWNPIVLGAVVLGGAAFRAFLTGRVINNRIKDEVGKQVEQRLRDQRPEQAAQIARRVDTELEKLQAALDEVLSGDIQRLRDTVTAIIDEKRHGQADIDKAIRALKAQEAELDAIDGALDDSVKQAFGWGTDSGDHVVAAGTAT